MKKKTSSGVETMLQTLNTWLGDLQDELRWQDRQRAYTAFRAVLHPLRDCLSVEEVADLGAQLPTILRGIYYEGWTPSKPSAPADLEEFLDAVRRPFRGDPKLDAEQVARGVFTVMARHLSRGEMRELGHVLPDAIQELWPWHSR